MRASEAARNEAETTALLQKSVSKAVLGLWRFNGVDETADPVHLFMGVGLGLLLLMERTHYLLVCENAERIEAKATEAQLVQARRMVKGYQSAMDGLAREIKGQTQQLELF